MWPIIKTLVQIIYSKENPLINSIKCNTTPLKPDTSARSTHNKASTRTSKTNKKNSAKTSKKPWTYTAKKTRKKKTSNPKSNTSGAWLNLSTWGRKKRWAISMGRGTLCSRGRASIEMPGWIVLSRGTIWWWQIRSRRRSRRKGTFIRGCMMMSRPTIERKTETMPRRLTNKKTKKTTSKKTRTST